MTSHEEAGTDVIDLIMQDHREFERQFAKLREDPASRATLGPVMSTLLTAHERAEESEVYPAVREAGAHEDVEHSQQEHLAADEIARRLQETDPGSPDFDSVLTELMDAVQHHLEEEEADLLPQVRKLLDESQRVELGAAFLAARAAHLGDQPDDITKSELAQQAENIGLSVGSKSKDQLEAALEDEAEL